MITFVACLHPLIMLINHTNRFPYLMKVFLVSLHRDKSKQQNAHTVTCAFTPTSFSKSFISVISSMIIID